jgi:hypothetical protein
MHMPSQDVDFSVFDADVLDDLAWRWDLSRALVEWEEQVARTGDIHELSEPPVSLSSSPAPRRAQFAHRNQLTEALMGGRRVTGGGHLGRGKYAEHGGADLFGGDGGGMGHGRTSSAKYSRHAARLEF